MSDDLSAVLGWVEGLMAALSPEQRRTVNRAVAQDLRRSQRQRIADQRNPDGTRFAPRAPQKQLRGRQGRVRRRSMFAKLRTVRHLKNVVTADEILIGFTGRAGSIAAVHQAGGEHTTRDGRTFKTPARKLLGFSAADLDLVRDAYLRHLAKP